MNYRTLPITLYLLLVFASGAVVGALGYRTYSPPTARGGSEPLSPSEWRRQYIEESKARLSLTDDQVAKLGGILDQTDVRFQQEHELENQMIHKIKEEHIARVRTILTPEQLPKYEQLVKEHEERRKQEERQRNR